MNDFASEVGMMLSISAVGVILAGFISMHELAIKTGVAIATIGVLFICISISQHKLRSNQ